MVKCVRCHCLLVISAVELYRASIVMITKAEDVEQATVSNVTCTPAVRVAAEAEEHHM